MTSRQEKSEEKWLLLTRLSCKDVLMVLLVLDSAISSSEAGNRIVKAMNKLQDSVYKLHTKADNVHIM
jgi:hypothetical protein